MKLENNARRRALKALGLGALVVAGGAGQLLLSQQARAGLKVGDPAVDDFISVSQLLSGHQAVNVALAQALYQAFADTTPDFAASLGKLKAALSQGALADGGKTAFTDEQNGEQALSAAILQAWYLGTVGKGKKARCVTYTDGLSNLLVAGKLVPPSYSYGPCGSWQVQPGLK